MGKREHVFTYSKLKYGKIGLVLYKWGTVWLNEEKNVDESLALLKTYSFSVKFKDQV